MEGTVLPDSSEGNAHPCGLSSVDTLVRGSAHTYLDIPHNPYDVDAINAAFDAIVAEIGGDFLQPQNADRLAKPAADLNVALNQSGRSWRIPGQPPAQVWTSRRYWLRSVSSVLKSEKGRALCKAHRVAPDTCYAIAVALAEFADSATGRNVAASNRRIGALAARKIGRAEAFSHDTAGVARRVLAELGLAVEVARGRHLSKAERLLANEHHGGNQTRAASVWALISPREPDARPYLPSRGFTPREGSCSRKSPTRARKRTRAPFGRLCHHQNRPLAAQKLAAELVDRIPALDRGHIGAIVDVVIETVDYQRWNANDLVKLIDLDGQRRGIMWPATITKPAAFLRHRLAGLATELAGPSPSELEAAHLRRIRAEQAARKDEAQRKQASTARPETRQAAMAEFRAQMAAKRKQRRS